MAEPTKGKIMTGVCTVITPGVRVTITPQEVGYDPPITIFHVAIERIEPGKEGIWTGTFGSKELLRAFLRGLEVAAVMIGGTPITRPEITFTTD